MPRMTTAATLASLIDKLKAERAQYVQRIAEIDQTFTRLGIGAAGPAAAAPAAAKVGRPAQGGKRRRKRGKFATTGDDSVVAFVKAHPKCSAKEVNVHWRSENRGGKADNTLTRMVQIRKLKRVTIKGERGGRYVVA